MGKISSLILDKKYNKTLEIKSQLWESSISKT